MNPTAIPADNPAPFPEDELSQFELHVARRADELARMNGPSLSRDLEFWLQAERELLQAPGDLPPSLQACD
jgi:hypothetical protein